MNPSDELEPNGDNAAPDHAEPSAEHGEEPLILSDADLIDDEPVDESIEVVEIEEPRVKLPRPGLFGSLLWIGGFFAVQAGLFVGFLLLFNPLAIDRLIAEEELNFSFLKIEDIVRLVVMVQLMVVILSIISARVAFGRRMNRHLPMTPPAVGHALLVVLLIFPLCFLDMYIASVFQQIHHRITGEPVEVPESMQEIMELIKAVPLGLALFAVAIAPAIAEEIIFRGIIGRGLIARYGILGGVLVTSVLFAVVHLVPMQVVALMPIAVMLHVVYLSTRSFWMPMLLHFLNNAIAVMLVYVQLHYPRSVPDAVAADDLTEITAAGPTAIIAATATVAIGMMLWQTRVQFFRNDQSETPLTPRFPTVDPPPEGSHTVKQCQPPSGRLLLTTMALYVLFWIGLLDTAGVF